MLDTCSRRTAPPHFSGLLAEYMGGTQMIFADCGDRSYEWLPNHDVAGSDDEDGLVAQLRFPELGSLLCCGFSVAVLVMTGCKLRCAEQRHPASCPMWCKIKRSLQKFRALWSRNLVKADSPAGDGARKGLRLKRPKKPTSEEAAAAQEGQTDKFCE